MQVHSDYGQTDRAQADPEEDPTVVPLDVSGCFDTDHSKLTASELMLYGLASLWENNKEGGYAIRHGGRAVSDFGPSRQRNRGNAAARARNNRADEHLHDEQLADEADNTS